METKVYQWFLEYPDKPHHKKYTIEILIIRGLLQVRKRDFDTKSSFLRRLSTFSTFTRTVHVEY